jgi:hypothetical protein
LLANATVAQLKAQISGDRAAIDSAQTLLDYTTITSPLTGRPASGWSIRATSCMRRMRPALSSSPSCTLNPGNFTRFYRA